MQQTLSRDTLEQRLRRRAKRLDLVIRKSRRDGSYMVVDAWRNWIVGPADIFRDGTNGFDLEELEAFLDERED